jgi:uncharacterized protein DUF4178
MARQISCPSCGAPLQIESAYTTLLTCRFCGQSLYVRDSGVDPTGKTAKLADFPSRLSVGAQGKLKGRGFKTLGRVRYQYEQGFWDEWFLQFDNQQVGWIVEDEGDLTLAFKSKLTTPVPPFEQVRVGSFIPIGHDNIFISEKGHGQVAGAEGEVSMVAPPGHAIQYIDGNAANKALRLLIDEHGITLQTGEPLEFNDLVVASS